MLLHAIYALFFAILAYFFLEKTKCGRGLTRWVLSIGSKFQKRINAERNLSKPEVIEAIRSNFPDQIPNTFVTDPVSKNNALTWNKKWVYTDTENNYLFDRYFSVFPLINGNETFYREACECLASAFVNIDTSNKFLFVYLDKETNRLFKAEFVGQHFPGKVQCHPIICNESRTAPRFNLKYEKGESLAGCRIVLLECYVLVPEVITATITWLQDQGAVVEGVAILFMGAEGYFNDNACGVNRDNVRIEYFVDLKISKFSEIKQRRKKLKILTYSDY